MTLGRTIGLALDLRVRILIPIERILEERQAAQSKLERALDTTETVIET